MKKQLLNLGKGLNKAEQKTINGGVNLFACHWTSECIERYNDPYALCINQKCVVS